MVGRDSLEGLGTEDTLVMRMVDLCCVTISVHDIQFVYAYNTNECFGWLGVYFSFIVIRFGRSRRH